MTCALVSASPPVLRHSYERVPGSRNGDVARFEDVLHEVLAEAGGASGHEEDSGHIGYFSMLEI